MGRGLEIFDKIGGKKAYECPDKEVGESKIAWKSLL